MSVVIWTLLVLSVLSLVVQLLFIGTGAIFGYGFWTGVLLAAVFAAFAVYRGRLRGLWKYPGWVAMGLVFLILIPYCFYALVLLPLNYPPEQPFQEKLTVEGGSEQEERNFRRLNELMSKWNKRYENVVDQVEGEVEPDLRAHKLNEQTRFVVDKTDTARARVINFSAANRIAFPEQELTVDGSKKLSTMSILALYDLELTAVKRALRENRPERARGRYIRLWRGIESSVRPPVFIVHHLVNLELVSKLAGFYADNPKIRPSLEGTDFINHLESTWSNLSRAGRRSMAYEYTVMKSALDKTRHGERNIPESLKQLASGSWLSASLNLGGYWPIYDYWKTRRKWHDLYYRLSQFFPENYHEISDRLSREQAQVEEKLENWSQFGLAHLENPVGKLLISASFPQVFDMVFDTAKMRSKLAMVAWVHETRPGFEQAAAPSDGLTGDPYEVETAGDTLIVRSPYSGPRNNGEPVQMTFVK